MKNNKYIIYAKLPEEKIFYPVSGGNIVKNLIYAEMYFEKEVAEKSCQSMQSLNPEIKFEVRETH